MDAWHCFKYFTLLIFLYMVLLISYYPHFTNELKRKLPPPQKYNVYVFIYMRIYTHKKHTHIYDVYIALENTACNQYNCL